MQGVYIDVFHTQKDGNATVGGEISRLLHTTSAWADQERQELARLDSDIGARVNSLSSQLQQLTARRDGELRMA